MIKYRGLKTRYSARATRGPSLSPGQPNTNRINGLRGMLDSGGRFGVRWARSGSLDGRFSLVTPVISEGWGEQGPYTSSITAIPPALQRYRRRYSGTDRRSRPIGYQRPYSWRMRDIEPWQSPTMQVDRLLTLLHRLSAVKRYPIRRFWPSARRMLLKRLRLNPSEMRPIRSNSPTKTVTVKPAPLLSVWRPFSPKTR